MEVLVSGLILTLLLASFARLGVQSQRNTTTLTAAALSADAATTIAQDITLGNAAVIPQTGTRTLTTAQVSGLARNDVQARILASGLTATVTAQGGTPPQYRVTVTAPGTALSVLALGPGGTE